jgi:hypothetical protein
MTLRESTISFDTGIQDLYLVVLMLPPSLELERTSGIAYYRLPTDIKFG